LISKKIVTGLLISCLIVSFLAGFFRVFATNSEANLYMVKLEGIPSDLEDSWVTDTDAACRGAIAACQQSGISIQFNLPVVHPKRNVDYPPYYNAVPKIVTSWSQYKSIIESYVDVTVVNTHGQYLPVPSGYSNEAWVDKIAEAMLTRKVTWVHTSGYTFLYVWSQANGNQGIWTMQRWPDNTTIGCGFARLMNQTNLSNLDLWPPSGTESNLVDVARNLVLNGDWNYWWQFQAELGRPLKFDDVSQYEIMNLFTLFNDVNPPYSSYFAGAVIAFAKVGQRYTQSNEYPTESVLISILPTIPSALTK